MDYITVWDVAEKWGITERMVRNYCMQGLIPGAYQTNHIWAIPENATRPRRKQREKSEAPRPIMARKLGNQQKKRNFHGMYDYTLLNLTYSSCRMASCRLTRGQVESIIKNGKVAETFEAVKISDLIEVRNHIECTNFVLKAPMEPLTIKYIKDLHELYQTMTGKPFKEKGYLRHLLPLQPPPAKVPHQRPQTHTRNKYSINSKSPVHSELGFCESFMLCG